MSYYTRILLASVLLAAVTALVIWIGPRARDVTIVAQSPSGQDVGVGAPIRITFSRPVDRQSLEENLQITPPIESVLFWEQNQVTLRPIAPLQPDTLYEVTIGADLRDEAGTPNSEPLGWTFRTRSPRILIQQPDGSAGTQLLRVSLDGNTRELVYASPQPLRDLAVAPDGERVSFTQRNPDGSTSIYILDLNAGTVTPLVANSDVNAEQAVWSSSGASIAYLQTPRTSDATTIWQAQPDGTSLGPLYSDNVLLNNPVWSPDGLLLAFTDPATNEVGVYNFTSEQQRFPDSDGTAATWAPDSGALAYTTAAGGLRRVDLADGTLVDLTTGSPPLSTPLWAPDGTSIAYLVTATDTTTLWQVRPDGSDAQQLTANTGTVVQQPAWSPDSSTIAVLERASPDVATGTLLLVDALTGDSRPLAEDVSTYVWAP